MAGGRLSASCRAGVGGLAGAPGAALPLRLAALVLALLLAAAPAAGAASATRIKVGFVSTLSGASAAPGIDIRDGFQLALKHLDGRLGGLPAEVLVADDQQNPDLAQAVVKRLVQREQVTFMTGIVFSDILLAVGPTVFAGRSFYLSAHAGPSAYAGKGCNPYFFSLAGENGSLAAAMGKYMQGKDFGRVVLVVPADTAGKDVVAGFRRHYRGQVAGEVRATPGRLDYGAELAEIRAHQPDAVFFSLPGGMGASFLRQFVAAGLAKDIQLFAAGTSADEDVIKALGSPLLGLFNASPWAHDLDNPENRRFVAGFQREYGRIPSLHAAQGYDTAHLMDAAVREVKGRVADKAALGRALAGARFKSVRGTFRFNRNHFPVQDIHLRVVAKDAAGRVTNQAMGMLLGNQADPYAPACRMK